MTGNGVGPPMGRDRALEIAQAELHRVEQNTRRTRAERDQAGVAADVIQGVRDDVQRADQAGEILSTVRGVLEELFGRRA